MRAPSAPGSFHPSLTNASTTAWECAWCTTFRAGSLPRWSCSAPGKPACGPARADWPCSPATRWKEARRISPAGNSPVSSRTSVRASGRPRAGTTPRSPSPVWPSTWAEPCRSSPRWCARRPSLQRSSSDTGRRDLQRRRTGAWIRVPWPQTRLCASFSAKRAPTAGRSVVPRRRWTPWTPPAHTTSWRRVTAPPRPHWWWRETWRTGRRLNWRTGRSATGITMSRLRRRLPKRTAGGRGSCTSSIAPDPCSPRSALDMWECRASSTISSPSRRSISYSAVPSVRG